MAIETLNEEHVEELRQEFLTLTRNAKDFDSPEQALEFRDYLMEWRRDYLGDWIRKFKRSLKENKSQRGGSVPDYVVETSIDDVEEAMDKLVDRLVDFPSADLKRYDYDEDVSKARDSWEYVPGAIKEEVEGAWFRSVRRYARLLWDELNEIIDLFEDHDASIEMRFPEERVERIEGFTVKIIGFETAGDYTHDDKMKRLKEALRQYKRRAQKTVPVLLDKSDQVAFEFDFDCDRSVGGLYVESGPKIKVCASLLSEDVDRLVQVFAHEMGHHVWKTLGGKQKEWWREMIESSQETLHVEDILDMWPEDMNRRSFEDKLKKVDPSLYIQLDALSRRETSPIGTSLYTRDDFERYSDDTIDVYDNLPTGYASKSPEEAFCEVLGRLLGYGPRTVHDVALRWLKAVMPYDIHVASMSDRIASKYARRLRKGSILSDLWGSLKGPVLKLRKVFQDDRIFEGFRDMIGSITPDSIRDFIDKGRAASKLVVKHIKRVFVQKSDIPTLQQTVEEVFDQADLYDKIPNQVKEGVSYVDAWMEYHLPALSRMAKAAFFVWVWIHVDELSWEWSELQEGFLGMKSIPELIRSLPESAIGFLTNRWFGIGFVLMPAILLARLLWLESQNYVAYNGGKWTPNWDRIKQDIERERERSSMSHCVSRRYASSLLPTTSMPARIASKYVRYVESGSIDVDHDKMEHIVERLFQQATDYIESSRPNFGEKDTLKQLDYDVLAVASNPLEDVHGRDIRVDVRLVVAQTSNVKGKAFLDDHAIDLYVPEDWTFNMLELAGRKNFVNTLVHEWTHMKDHIESLDYESRDPGESRGEAFWDRYFNDPAEVQSHISQIVHEIEDRVEMFMPSEGFQDAVRLALSSSSKWNEMGDHLDEESRQKILKEVYRQLRDRIDV